MKALTRGLLITTIPLLLQLGFASWLAGELSRVYDDVDAVYRSREVSGHTLELVRTILSDYYTLNMNCEIEGTLDEETLTKSRLAIGNKLAEVRQMLDGRPGQSANSTKLTRVAQQFAAVMDWAQKEQKSGLAHWKQVDEQCYSESFRSLTEFFEVASRIIQQEEGHADYKSALQRAEGIISRAIWICFSVSVLLALLLGKLYGLQVSAPIAHLLRQSRLIAGRKPLEKPLSGNDEFAELDRRLNRVAAALYEIMARERDLINDSSEAICSFTRDGQVRRANARASELFRAPAEELIKANVLDWLSPECRHTALATFEKAERGGVTVMLKVVPTPTEVLDTQWSLSWSSKEERLFCVISDLSEEIALRSLKQDFFDFIARSIVLPLREIGEELDVLYQSCQLVTHKESQIELESARRTARRILAMATQLLDFKQLDQGRLELHFSIVDLRGLVTQGCELLAEVAAGKELTMTVSGHGGAVKCDPDRILQVILNLLSNAIKFSPKGTCIEIALRADADAVGLSVSDSGPGVKDEVMEKIFEPFEQLEGAGGGAGLGLAISRMIVLAHGGKIWAAARRSAPGAQGAVFSFNLPCRK